MPLENTSNIQKQQVDYYIGYIIEVLDAQLYQIKVCVPGMFDEIKAFPTRNCLDEPRVGDFVLLRSFDPIYHSFFLWEKLKENSFIGLRSNGKMISITPDYIEMAIFDPEEEWVDDQKDEKYNPKPTSWITLDKDGNLDVVLNSDKSKLTATIAGSSEISIHGNCTINIGGNGEIKSTGNLNLDATGTLLLKGNKVEFGGGMVVMDGTPVPGYTPGPFMVMPAAPAPGTPNITSPIVMLNK